MQRRDKVEELGFTAIKVLDERACWQHDLDGLSWRIVMHELFENWVEQLVRRWAKDFGGRVTCARKHDSQSPIHWERSGLGSLSSLIPDVVVETADDTFIFDAKYKGFLEETEDLRWRDAKRCSDEHVTTCIALAYASMYKHHVTVALVYPTTIENWTRLSERGRDVSLGTRRPRQADQTSDYCRAARGW
jgi:5-methylcytosine-specific restriction endonuclease McrBC regulatory subunit McrC